MAGGSGNGDPPKRYTASSTDWYRASCESITRRYPRVHQVGLFKQIEAMVRLFPPHDYAERVGDRTWLLVTQEGRYVPEVDVFFMFEGGHVTLQDAIADA
jgi:hypothetical protein